jgi:hypothetical protein
MQAQDAEQGRLPRATGNPLTGPSVRGAPFTADATTVVRWTLRDGTRIDRTSSARYYRDGLGRVRVEQPVKNDESLNQAISRWSCRDLQVRRGGEAHVRITIAPTPGDGSVYTLDTSTGTTERQERKMVSVTLGGDEHFSLPLGGPQFLIFHRPERANELRRDRPETTDDVKEESLGGRRIAGVSAIGRRVTLTIPAGRVGNEQPIGIVDERWESPELEIVVHALSVDPRFGVIEYRLANIRRTEPDPTLFVVPDGYALGYSADTERTTLVFADNAPPNLPACGREQ